MLAKTGSKRLKSKTGLCSSAVLDLTRIFSFYIEANIEETNISQYSLYILLDGLIYLLFVCRRGLLCRNSSYCFRVRFIIFNYKEKWMLTPMLIINWTPQKLRKVIGLLRKNDSLDHRNCRNCHYLRNTEAIYVLPPATSKRYTTFGYGTKINLATSSHSPPPGSYNPPSDF